MKEDAEYLKQILPALAKEMPYKWRVQSFSKFKPEASCVAYVDARDVQDRLDKVCDYGWDRDHKEIKGHLYAGIGIMLPSGRMSWRWDCGSESNIEAEKGESSDSFKRAGVNWKIGRFLYDLKVKTLPANEKKGTSQYSPKIVDNNGKWVEDLTEYINGNPKPAKRIEGSKEDIGKGENEHTHTIKILLLSMESIESKESLERWMGDNKKTIDILGVDKGLVMNPYYKLKKELK